MIEERESLGEKVVGLSLIVLTVPFALASIIYESAREIIDFSKEGVKRKWYDFNSILYETVTDFDGSDTRYIRVK